ncbi:hypothetical protein FHETE_9352 [Fusarium heterosporum]|uniref:Uncharacterized protein n=1 Tax=Fusarium heterosporum TaxID=42747 RepID=A0A8H5WIN5_FUSHE|nr:hypothetical protein FHETE_9352 [Fusarium heterosporum]
MPETPRDHIVKYLSDPSKALRPIFTSLNGDNSWLMSFPRPESERAATGKVFYHLVFEPWLKGAAHVLNSWFVNIAMVNEPEVSTFGSIENLVREIEHVAVAYLPSVDRNQDVDLGVSSPVDAILLGFYLSDHLHPETLKSFPPHVPIIATPPAVDVIKPWKHFKTIRVISNLSPSATSWKTPDLHPGDPLPTWLTPIFLPGRSELNFVFAIIWSHTMGNEEIHEAILDSPHGVKPEEKTLNAFLDSEPKTKKLAMLHGLKESRTGGVLTTYGAKGGLALNRKVGGVEHWIVTHSSELEYTGVFMRVVGTKDTPRTIEWALEEEEKKDSNLERVALPNVVRVANGGSMILV